MGVSTELLRSGQPSVVPEHEPGLRRIMIEPGGSVPAHTHRGALVIYLDSGTWGYTALNGSTQLTRSAVNGTPSPAEELTVDEEIILKCWR